MYPLTNFYEETLLNIVKSGHGTDDIAWIGDSEQTYVPNLFFELIKKIYYHSGFGRNAIIDGLVIVFTDNSWLSRRECPDPEGWKYNKPPTRPLKDCFDMIPRDILTASCLFEM